MTALFLKYLSILSLLAAIVLCTVVNAANIPSHGSSLTKRHPAHFNASAAALAKRVDNARLTYYKAGQGACGGNNGDSDWIVALNSKQFDNGAHCWKNIEITYNGKTAKAQIVDECPGCPEGGLDLTSGLFSYFASTDQGVIYGQWDMS